MTMAKAKWKDDLKAAYDRVRPLQDAPSVTRHANVACRVAKKSARTYEFIGTTSRVADDGGILEPDGLDDTAFRANPVALWAHNSGMPPIGRWSHYERTDDGWRFTLELADTSQAPLKGTTHADLIDAVDGLIGQGVLRATSVGFRVKKYRELTQKDRAELGLPDGGWVGKEWELKELSVVPVGADPGALAVAASVNTQIRAALTAARFEIPEGATMKREDEGEGDEGMPAEDMETEVDAFAEISGKLDAIAEALAVVLDAVKSGEKAAEDDEEEGDETPADEADDDEEEDEEPRGSGSKPAGLYDDLFAAVNVTRRAAQEVAGQ